MVEKFLGDICCHRPMWCPKFKLIPEVVQEIYSAKKYPNIARNDVIGDKKVGNFDFQYFFLFLPK